MRFNFNAIFDRCVRLRYFSTVYDAGAVSVFRLMFLETSSAALCSASRLHDDMILPRVVRYASLTRHGTCVKSKGANTMDAAGAASRDRIKALYAERSAMETEMAEIAQRLSGPGMPGLRGSLVDAEGFPAPGVDLYAVREKKAFFLFFCEDAQLYLYTRLRHRARVALSFARRQH